VCLEPGGDGRRRNDREPWCRILCRNRYIVGRQERRRERVPVRGVHFDAGRRSKAHANPATREREVAAVRPRSPASGQLCVRQLSSYVREGGSAKLGRRCSRRDQHLPSSQPADSMLGTQARSCCQHMHSHCASASAARPLYPAGVTEAGVFHPEAGLAGWVEVDSYRAGSRTDV